VPIEFPKNRKEITNRMKNDVRAELGPNSNPFLRNSALGSLIFGMAGRIFDFFSQLKFLLLNLFPDTATGSFLERWGSYVKIGRLPASIAEGKITIGGVFQLPAPIIPDGTVFQSTTQEQYISIGTSVVAELEIIIIELTQSGGIATAKTSGTHPFAAGINPVTISGAIETDYNGTDITITGVPALDEFTYNIAGNPPSPATTATSIEAKFSGAQVTLESEIFGEAANLGNGETVALGTPLAGVENSGFVQFEGISGGADVEDDASFRARILDRYQNPVSFFNVAQIEQKVKTLDGVTRVFVQEITPTAGDITVFFVEDNQDGTIIPSLTDRQRAKEKIFEIKPANVDGGSLSDPADGDIKLPALAPKIINFVFIALDPDDSPSLKDAIKNNLDAFFRGENNVNENISQSEYECTINDSFDNAGKKVKSFTLSSPTGDIVVGVGEIAVLGSVSFNF